MFTGIIEEIGFIDGINPIPGGKRLKIGAASVLENTLVNDSISVDGICLTVISLDNNFFYADAVGETLEKTTLSNVRTGVRVNLERALQIGARLGGHFVAGHINGVGIVNYISKRGDNYYLDVRIPEKLSKYVIAEGSIALNGISLTVAETSGDRAGFSIIPHTWTKTNLKFLKSGDKMNIETDLIARHIEKLLFYGTNSLTGGLNVEKLKEMGY